MRVDIEAAEDVGVDDELGRPDDGRVGCRDLRVDVEADRRTRVGVAAAAEAAGVRVGLQVDVLV